MDGLITANTWFGSMHTNPNRTMTFDIFRQSHLAALRKRFSFPERPLNKEAEPVTAFVNRGAWLARCPDCRGAEYAWEEGVFFCTSCLNSGLVHRYRRLVFPEERGRIEELLIVRPVANRNWNLGEAIEVLERENEEHAAELLTATAAEGG